MLIKCALFLSFSLFVEKVFSDSDFATLNETEFKRTKDDEYVRATVYRASRFNSEFKDIFTEEYFQDAEKILKVTSADEFIRHIKEGVQTLQSFMSLLKKINIESNKISDTISYKYTEKAAHPIANKTETLYNTSYSSSPITVDFYDINLHGVEFSKADIGIVDSLPFTPSAIHVSGKHDLKIDGQSFEGSFDYELVGANISLRSSNSVNWKSYIFEVEEILKYGKIGNENVTFVSDAKTKDDLLLRKLHLEAFLKSNLPLTSLVAIADLNKLHVKSKVLVNWNNIVVSTYEKKIVPSLFNLLKLYLKKIMIEKNDTVIEINSDVNGKPIRFENIDKFSANFTFFGESGLYNRSLILHPKAVYSDSKAIIHYESKTYQVNSIKLAFQANLTSIDDVNIDFADKDTLHRLHYYAKEKFDPIDFANTDVDQSVKDVLNSFVKEVSLKFIREALKKTSYIYRRAKELDSQYKYTGFIDYIR